MVLVRMCNVEFLIILADRVVEFEDIIEWSTEQQKHINEV
jgi:hypothetical protein